MLEIKNTVTEMDSAFGQLICRLARAKEIVRELKDMLIEISQTEKQRGKRNEKQIEVNTKNYGTIKKM